ncbi:MAG: putative transposase [Acidimicrobiales bacterium]
MTSDPVVAPNSDDEVAGELVALAKPAKRSTERAAACGGTLDEAAPVICKGASLPLVGSLLILPALAATGLIEAATVVYGAGRKVKGIHRSAFYGLRSLVLCVVFSCLVGEPRAEGATRLDPVAIGRLLGLDRAPELKRLRFRMAELASEHRADELVMALAQHHVDAHPEEVGLLYIDGYVRAYHGGAETPKAHVARIRLVTNPAKRRTTRHAAEAAQSTASAEANRGKASFDRMEANRELANAYASAQSELDAREPTAKAIPAKVPLALVRPAPVRIDVERKRVMDAIRMATYNAECSLARLLAPHYARAEDEARSLLHEAFRTSADLKVIGAALHVRIEPLSASPAHPSDRRTVRSAQRHRDHLPRDGREAGLLRQGGLTLQRLSPYVRSPGVGDQATSIGSTPTQALSSTCSLQPGNRVGLAASQPGRPCSQPLRVHSEGFLRGKGSLRVAAPFRVLARPCGPTLDPTLLITQFLGNKPLPVTTPPLNANGSPQIVTAPTTVPSMPVPLGHRLPNHSQRPPP